MMNFPVLYKRTSTGSVQQWQIIVSGDSYHTESGKVGGVLVKSEPTKVSGKNLGKINQTTANEQAVKDAQAKFDKQLKSEGYFEDINEIDNLPFEQPMLAKSLKDRKHVDYTNALIQCKFNGGRCNAKANGLFTRKGERYLSVPHIENELKEFFAENPGAMLDGELFNDSLKQSLNEIMKLIRRTVNLNQEHYDQSKKLIKFYVYDGYGFNGTTKNTPYLERKKYLDEIVKKYNYLELVETIPVNSEEEMWKKYQQYVDNGDEGAILRFEDSKYEHRRTDKLLKIKPVDDDEFLIIDILPGTGNWAGAAKIINLRIDDGAEFSATFKGNREDAKEVLINKHLYIGNKYTMQYNGFTGLKIPNYCQWNFRNSTEDTEK